jgi:outer membrane protein W
MQHNFKGPLFIVFLLFFANYSGAQTVENKNRFFDPSKKFTLVLYSTYVSSAEVQNNLNSSDQIERAALTDLKGGFGFGFELDYKPAFFNLDLICYISTDYLKLDQKDIVYQYYNGVNIIAYKANDKFILIPAELGIKWPLPVSTDKLRIYIGGGAGLYFGSHTRYLGNLTSQNTKSKPGFSLNVLAGLDYYLEKNIAAGIELKFREASFDTESKYNYITTMPNQFATRLIVDGVRVSAGLKYNF